MKKKHYQYGMKYRGFSPGCQPMEGFIKWSEDDQHKYFNLVTYDRPLTDDELYDYELDFIGSHEAKERNYE